MQQSLRIFQVLLVCVCLVGFKHALELVDEQAKSAESSEALDMEEKPLPVTEYGKDMATHKNPSDRGNGLKQMWEKIPAEAPSAQAQPPSSTSSAMPTSKHMKGIK